MRIPRSLLVAGFCLSATLMSTLSGCGSDGGNGPGNPLAGDWNVTSFVVQGTDAIANGMTFSMTLSGGGAYTFDITNDLIGVCDPDPDCTDSGPYSHTTTTLTFDPGVPQDEVTFDYSIQGTTLTLTGSINGTPATIILEKV